MNKEEIMEILKVDLGISAEAYDKYLKNMIESAEAAISREGIKLQNNTEDNMLIEMYAAYLYRKRKEGTEMPRQLRWLLNNRLFDQKAKGQ